jgi:hypothetical protein
MRLLLGILFISATLVTTACGQTRSDGSQLFGDWTGESKCVGTNNSCHDEVVVYHISRSKTDSKKITIGADKIVDGKPDFMGNIECDYDATKQTLTSEFTIPRTGGKGVWLFKIDGDKMTGTLTVLPENEVGRKVNVSKVKVPKP